jgi:hypothetical protein
MIDVSDIVSDADLAQVFTILRSTGTGFQYGVWQSSTTTLSSYGPVQPATDRDISMLAEGDRVKEVKAFWSSQPIYGTNAIAGVGQSSDILVWQGLNYRVLHVAQQQDYGFWKALAVRMKSD